MIKGSKDLEGIKGIIVGIEYTIVQVFKVTIGTKVLLVPKVSIVIIVVKEYKVCIDWPITPYR
ncbi:hypothetical protein GCM10027185_61640 [Spirosoma pulveris]